MRELPHAECRAVLLVVGVRRLRSDIGILVA